GEIDLLVKHGHQRHGAPSPTWRIDEHASGALNHTRDADADADDAGWRDGGIGQDGVQSRHDVAHHAGWPVVVDTERVRDRAQRTQRQIKEFDTDKCLADIDADKTAVDRVNCEDRARPAALGFLAASLDEDTLGEQFGGYIGDRRGTEAGSLAHLQTAHLPVDIDVLQDDAPISSPQITDGRPRSHQSTTLA